MLFTYAMLILLILHYGSSSFQWDFGNGQVNSNYKSLQYFDTIGIYNIQLISGNSYNCYDTLE